MAILSIVFFRLSPILSEIKSRSALRATRQEITAAFAAARSAAVQKGRAATVALSGVSASVTVVNAVNGSPLTVLGPYNFTQMHGTALTMLNSAPATVSFDARGLITPVTATVTKYRISSSKWADTICVSGAGIVLMRGCQL